MTSVPARAKLNLSLQILGVTDNGFHDLRSVMIGLDLSDTLTLQVPQDRGTGRVHSFTSPVPGTPGTRVDLRVIGGSPQVPRDFDNLVMRAANAWLDAFEDGDLALPEALEFTLRKRIPTEGGLGGGSADAAAAIRLLRKVLPLPQGRSFEIAAQLGSDVPFALLGGAALAEGRGERLTPIPVAKPFWVVLVRPPLSVSTPWCYRRWDEMFLDAQKLVHRDPPLVPDPGPRLEALRDGLKGGNLPQVCDALFNDLMPPVLDAHPHLASLPDVLRSAGCRGALMTGSGSCFFGLAQSRAAARKAAEEVRRRDLGQVWVTRTVTAHA